MDDPPTSNTGHFQIAQAAVADHPEFKGTVTAVHTGEYWDHELEALIQKGNKLNAKYGTGDWENLKGHSS